MSQKNALPLAMLLAVFSILGGSSVASAADESAKHQINPDVAAAISAGKHYTHNLPRPTDFSDFKSIDEWISANYLDTLIPDTLTHNIQDGQDAVSFFTRGDDGSYDHHILIDTGDGFTLKTTADLKVPIPADDISKGLSAHAISGDQCAISSTLGTPNKCDCVFYVRCRIPSYPRPAMYWTEKLKTINWPYPGSPIIGAVAIMAYSLPFGHVGIINNMYWVWSGWSANLYLTLDEANFTPCTVTYNRSGTIPQLRIYGYYLP